MTRRDTAYGPRAERWAISVLEAVWAGKPIPRRRGLGAPDLQRMVSASTPVSATFERLATLDDMLYDAVDDALFLRGVEEPPLRENTRSVGGFAFETLEAPNGFRSQVQALWSEDRDPLRTAALPGWLYATLGFAAACVMIFVFVPQPGEDDGLVARGAAVAQEGVSVTVHCLAETEGRVVPTELGESGGCTLRDRLAVSAFDAAGRSLSVIAVGLQEVNGRVRVLPYAPAPSRPVAPELELGALEQRVGPVIRLATNHGAGRLVVVGAFVESTVSWPEIEPGLTAFMDEAPPGADATVLADALVDNLKRVGVQPHARAVVETSLSLE